MRPKNKKMDRYLVSKQKWELKYIAEKFNVSIPDVLSAIKLAGRSRRKVYTILRSGF